MSLQNFCRKFFDKHFSGAKATEKKAVPAANEDGAQVSSTTPVSPTSHRRWSQQVRAATLSD